MMFISTQKRCLLGLLVLLLSGAFAAAQETAAEKARKVLDQPIKLNYAGQDLCEVIKHLCDVTKINFVLDQNAHGANQVMILPFGAPPPAGPPGAVEIKSDNAKLHVALERLLADHGLTYVILENSVLITTEDQAATRQLTQRVNVRVSRVPLEQALKDLTRSTPVNLVIDPRVAIAQGSVSLNVDGVTVETAIRLLSELAGLKAVRVDNVLFVTSEQRADKMRNEQPPLKTKSGQQFPNVFGGPGGMGFGIAPALRPVPVAPPPAKPAPPPEKIR